MKQTRRGFVVRLAAGTGLASGTVTVAGCLSFGDGNDGPEPLDLDTAELGAVARIEIPEVSEELPVELSDGHVEAHRSRAEELLDAVPSDLGGIPNEAVRNYIAEEREDARDRLPRIGDDRSNYELLDALSSTRYHAAEAEGAYAAARGERVREDVYDAADPVADQLSAVEEGLVRTGDVPRHAVLVYDEIERRLERAGRRLGAVDRVQPVVSEVEAVGEADSNLELARTHVEISSDVLDVQIDERTFDPEFERVGREILGDVEDRADVLPAGADDPGDELFDATVSDTPQERIAGGVSTKASQLRIDDIRTQLDGGQVAGALLRLYQLDHLVRTVERLQASVADGAYGRPQDVEAVRNAKETAVSEITAVLDREEYPYLTRHLLTAGIWSPVSNLERGDSGIGEEGMEQTERYPSVSTIGYYALAIEQARAVPRATEWFVERLP